MVAVLSGMRPSLASLLRGCAPASRHAPRQATRSLLHHALPADPGWRRRGWQQRPLGAGAPRKRGGLFALLALRARSLVHHAVRQGSRAAPDKEAPMSA